MPTFHLNLIRRNLGGGGKLECLVGGISPPPVDRTLRVYGGSVALVTGSLIMFGQAFVRKCKNMKVLRLNDAHAHT